MFQIYCGRFEQSMQDVIGTLIPFFLMFTVEMESSCLSEGMPVDADQMLTYSVPTCTFLDYFQMSEVFGRRACREFDAAIKQCYMDGFLCHPTVADIKSIVKLLKSQCNFDVDCTHTYWKNCSKAWHGAFKGKKFAIATHFLALPMGSW